MTADPLPQIRPATEDDHEAAAEALALAFADDPAWAHLLPDRASRAERLLSFFTAEIGNLAPDLRELWVTDDGSGAAIWARPGGCASSAATPALATGTCNCDEEGAPAHLEASTERNRALYERHGFSLTGSFNLPAGGPPLREMWREPL
jgi:hypothetical protein